MTEREIQLRVLLAFASAVTGMIITTLLWTLLDIMPYNTLVMMVLGAYGYIRSLVSFGVITWN